MATGTFSPLTSSTVPYYDKYDYRGGRTITKFIVHHWAGTRGGDSRLINPHAQVSANYILYSDGRLVGQVPEEFRAWTSGSWDADSQAITVEIQNCSTTDTNPEYQISDKALATLIKLIADVAKRYGWSHIDRSNVLGHREIVATACPGPYVWGLLPTIAKKADDILHHKPEPKPDPEPEPPKPEPEILEEDDDMKPTVHIREEKGYGFEATLGYPEYGLDLEPGESRKVRDKVSIRLGMYVTTDPEVAKAWARIWCRGQGKETSRTNRTDYIEIQRVLQETADELRSKTKVQYCDLTD